MREEIEERVKQVIVDKLGVEPEEVVTEANMIHDLGADSLDMVEIVMEFEKIFGINVSDDDGDKIQTVGDIIDIIEELKNEA